MIKILYIENDIATRHLMRALLPKDIEFHEAGSVSEGVDLLHSHHFSLVMIDLCLKDGSGFELIEYIKKKEFFLMPIIFIVTASDTEEDHIRSHDLGVDEYLTKPLRSNVFKSIVEKHLKRTEFIPADIKKVGPLMIDNKKMQVKLVNEDKLKELSLTLKEYKLLIKFTDHPGISFSRQQLFEDVWNSCEEPQSRTIDMHVSALRKKLGDYGNNIFSVRGKGYSFNPEHGQEAP